MPASKPVRKNVRRPVSSGPAPTAVADTPAASFFDRWAWALLTVVMLVGAGRIVATYNELSITFDESGHYACGLEYLSKHVYRYDLSHPPLARAMMALLPYLDGARTIGKPTYIEEASALLPAGPRFDRVLFLTRSGILPFFLVATAVVFVWARRYFGAATAVTAAAIFTLIPPVLAHGGLATTDMAVTACLGAAFYSLIRWVETPTMRKAVALGVWTGLAVLSKFTTGLYLPVAAAFALLGFATLRRCGVRELWELAKPRMASFGVAAGLAALLVWGGYFFSFGPVPQWKSGLRLPAPELFGGIQSVLEHNHYGHTAYLLGQTSLHGWWYFFPVVLSVKTPIAILLLFPVGLIACRFWRNLAGWLPLAFFAGVLVPAMAGNINIGVRHVLPAYLAMSIVAAAGLLRLARWLSRPALAAALVGGAFVWIAVPGIRQHPDYLAYLNEFVSIPENVVADSDLDWGQEFKRVSRFLKNAGAKEVTLAVAERGLGSKEWMEKEYGLPPIHPFDPLVPCEGWNVVSATAIARNGGWQFTGEAAERMTGRFAVLNRPWYDRRYPDVRVGGLLLYKIPPGFAPP